MSRLVIEPASNTNWQLLYQNQFVSQPINARERSIIPDVVLPLQAESRILAVRTASQSARSTWKNGGTLTPLINCGMVGFEQVNLTSFRLPCNASKLLILPKYSTTYGLKFTCPWWFEDLTLTIYEYIGSERDSTEEMIAELQTQVQLLL